MDYEDVISTINSEITIENDKKSYLEFKENEITVLKEFFKLNSNKKIAKAVLLLIEKIQSGEIILQKSEKPQ